ncbi:MAG: pyridoxal-phosphate dependent enzyme [Pseudomonadota bacterium]|nr:pyridoxal-phosphate dependent enzyme [Pseudomonadota bacterium]
MEIQRPLFNQYSNLRRSLPILELGNFPTPIEKINPSDCGIKSAGLWIKHDEKCASIYGGNKIRKLEFLLGEIKTKGYSSIITFGGIGSNHALATAIFCKEINLPCTVILFPEIPTDLVRKTLSYHLLLGSNVLYANSFSEARTLADQLIASKNEKYYEIPLGGSSWLGTCGFVNAGFELAAQIKAGHIPEPDKIYIALGTGGSAIGLAIALEISQIKSNILAIQVTPPNLQKDFHLNKLFHKTCKKLNALDKNFPLLQNPFDKIDISLAQLGKGYAIPTEEAKEASVFMDKKLGLTGSLTYTAKVMAALIADSNNKKLKQEQILFWNTFNAQAYPNFPKNNAWDTLPQPLKELFED